MERARFWGARNDCNGARNLAGFSWPQVLAIMKGELEDAKSRRRVTEAMVSHSKEAGFQSVPRVVVMMLPWLAGNTGRMIGPELACRACAMVGKMLGGGERSSTAQSDIYAPERCRIHMGHRRGLDAAASVVCCP